MAEMIRESDVHDVGAEDFTRQDLEEEIRRGDVILETGAWLVTATDDRPAAVLLLSTRAGRPPEALGWVHPEHRRRGLGAFLLGVAEKRAEEVLAGDRGSRAADARTRAVVANWIHHVARDAVELLEQSGYRYTRSFYRMAIDLDGPPPAPEWPPDTTVRPFQRGLDDRAVYGVMTSAFRDHWNHAPVEFEEWRRRRIKAPGVDPSLWFLAEVDGRAVAGSLCAVEGEEGWVETLGVLREARRKGVGMALLLHSFGELWRRGNRRVLLTVDAASLTGATRPYERTGMHVDRHYDHYEKELSPGVGDGSGA